MRKKFIDFFLNISDLNLVNRIVLQFKSNNLIQIMQNLSLMVEYMRQFVHQSSF